MLAGMYGSVPAFERFLQDNGFDKITGIFSAYPYATKYTAPHVRGDARPDRRRLRANTLRTSTG